ncbi:MAG: O-acetyl-ADP-ribose deacetylase [Lagierella massiliensis]|nr:O-acetyl-ADP-ribose deacetylase [Lagierella massiliensis]
MNRDFLSEELKDILRINYEKGNLVLSLGDITKVDVDAIVNAANKTLLGGGGVDGAIHKAAGVKLLEECRKLNGCNTGQAKITKGYNLPSEYVIHTVGPIYKEDKNPEENLSNCYENALKLAVKNDIKSIAFPGISTGVYGYPKREAAKVSLKAVLNFIKDYKSEIKIIFISYNEDSFNIYKEIFQENLR